MGKDLPAEEHSAAALAEAAAAWLTFDGCRDLSGVPFVTVDAASTRDLDQALHVARAGVGWRVRYALADAAHFVPVGSALWDEALARGASYYLPDRSIPMLPRSLCEGLVSLNEGVDRRALVMDVRLEKAGTVRRTEIFRARVRSRAKLSFEEVDAHGDGVSVSRIDDGIARSLDGLRAVGRLRRELSAEREVVRFRRRRGPRFACEDDNEQLSLLCNTEGARFLQRAGADAGAHPVYRVHPPPSQARLDRFRGMVSGAGRPWRTDEPLARYLDRLPDDRLSQAIHRQAIVLNFRSTYDVNAGAHYGVGADVYARFSAPMREVVGVFLHAEAYEVLDGTGHLDIAADEALRERVVEAANRSKELQRALDKEAALAAIDALFEASAGPHRGTVVGVTPTRVYVSLDDPPLDVKADRAELGKVRPRLGDEVDVSATSRDPGRAWWRLRVTPAG